MALTALIARRIYTPEPLDEGVVLFEDDRIHAVGTRDEVSVPAQARRIHVDNGCVTPGFIDLHNHGAGGHDVMEATPAALDAVCQMLARYGTTSFYPTTLTAPCEQIRRAVEFLAGYIDRAVENRPLAAQPLGIHMEGPYLNVKRRGVHPAEHIAEPTLDSFRAYSKAAGGKLRIVTIAPEVAGAAALIGEMLSTDIRPSMGHTDATYPEAEQAVRLGIRQVTHMFNAMRPFGHRDPGVIATALTDSRLRTELIADCVHVDPKAMELLYHCKGRDGIMLVSDGLSAVGMPEGEYFVGGLRVQVEGGVCRDMGTIAGSVLTLDQAVRNMHQRVGVPLAEAIQMATLNPATMMGISGRKGCLRPGADADLAILDETLHVRQVYLRGVPLAVD